VDADWRCVFFVSIMMAGSLKTAISLRPLADFRLGTGCLTDYEFKAFGGAEIAGRDKMCRPNCEQKQL
jgi:hypothetical protein